MKGIKDDMLGREASLAFWGDFLSNVSYNWSVILNREGNAVRLKDAGRV
jgi:hypothetical protein